MLNPHSGSRVCAAIIIIVIMREAAERIREQCIVEVNRTTKPGEAIIEITIQVLIIIIIIKIILICTSKAAAGSTTAQLIIATAPTE